LPLVDLVHGNIRELNEFAGSNDLQQSLRALEDWGVGAMVVHMGAKGAGYYCNGFLMVEESVTARRQVNTTGTGDVLSACMMLLDQERCSTLGEKLRLANLIVSQFIAGERSLIPAL
jgi:sugar/nucleoside kinase (ribokinase family)